MNDAEITAESNKLLALIEHPHWGVFVRIVDEDLKVLDNISSLVLEGRDRNELIREVEVRYHTIDKIRDFIASAITRAEDAKDEMQESKSEIINITEPHHL
jgi:hypothetical protein